MCAKMCARRRVVCGHAAVYPADWTAGRTRGDAPSAVRASPDGSRMERVPPRVRWYGTCTVGQWYGTCIVDAMVRDASDSMTNRSAVFTVR